MMYFDLPSIANCCQAFVLKFALFGTTSIYWRCLHHWFSCRNISAARIVIVLVTRSGCVHAAGHNIDRHTSGVPLMKMTA